MTADDTFENLPVVLQQAIARGDVQLEDLEKLAARTNGEICPRCGVRSVTTNRSGWCDRCHWLHLAQLQREHSAAVEAKTEYRREQKAQQRRIRCRVCGHEFSPRKDSEPRVSDRTLCMDCRDAGP